MNSNISSTLNTTVQGNHSHSIVSNGNSVNTWFSEPVWKTELDKLTVRLCAIEERLAILQPSFELHDKFPALKQAYEEYKVIERLVNDK